MTRSYHVLSVVIWMPCIRSVLFVCKSVQISWRFSVKLAIEIVYLNLTEKQTIQALIVNFAQKRICCRLSNWQESPLINYSGISIKRRPLVQKKCVRFIEIFSKIVWPQRKAIRSLSYCPSHGGVSFIVCPLNKDSTVFRFLLTSPTLFSTPRLLILENFTSLPFYSRHPVY